MRKYGQLDTFIHVMLDSDMGFRAAAKRPRSAGGLGMNFVKRLMLNLKDITDDLTHPYPV